eukprot:gene2215-7668_t
MSYDPPGNSGQRRGNLRNAGELKGYIRWAPPPT